MQINFEKDALPSQLRHELQAIRHQHKIIADTAKRSHWYTFSRYLEKSFNYLGIEELNAVVLWSNFNSLVSAFETYDTTSTKLCMHEHERRALKKARKLIRRYANAIRHFDSCKELEQRLAREDIRNTYFT
ncbi:hypothetical protein ACQU0X_25730 [Pseudovibrio ascidiaceicola]|uniref:hypothetical protein n=1 Tax=Pseudovibrio ascidiaceicola TaxID=285279 RepID=UPI003D3673DE